MRLLDRNKRPFYYALYTGGSMLQNQDGKLTGEHGKEYGPPVKAYANIMFAKKSGLSAASVGMATASPFGVNLDYDKIIQIEDVNCPIDEMSILWIDETDTSKPNDYVVKRKATALTHITLAVKKVR